MGQAKLRAEKRREAREESAKPDLRPKLRYFNEPISDRLIEQIKIRYSFLAGQFPSLGAFAEALLEAGMEVCDHDVNALLAHQRGESKHVDPQATPKDERLVLSPNEVSKEQVQTLAQVSGLGAGYRGKRTPQ